MEFETTSNGFILKVKADSGPTIEWNANEGDGLRSHQPELVATAPCSRQG